MSDLSTASSEESCPLVVRPWGHFEVLHAQRPSEPFMVKKIVVSPSSRLSLQSHAHRSEHWIILRGHGQAVIGGDLLHAGPGTHLFIPRNTKHRLINTDTTDVLEIVEVQCGDILSEEDIVRFQDDYERK